MNRYYSYFNSAKEIINSYTGEEPLAAYLKKFFSSDKKYGSKDRKAISHLCYCYFRLGKAFPDMPVEQRLIAGLFLCSQKPDEMLELVNPEWNAMVTNSPKQKFSMIGEQPTINDIFPWPEQMSSGLNYEEFCKSFLIQPDFFLRIRPGYTAIVKEKLRGENIFFQDINESCVAISNSSKVDAIIELDKEAVIQDLNSQRIGELMLLAGLQPSEKVWDCCAASGGKSILLYDLQPVINLTVSDIRESILINLKKRFEKAGIKKYRSLVADLSIGQSKKEFENYDLIIADVPCSGSGTWSRTPEQLFFFGEEEIQKYSELQKKILENVIPCLKPGGYLLYITCSVFSMENEAIVEFIKETYGLELKEMKLFTGYNQKADTLFGALFYKPLKF